MNRNLFPNLDARAVLGDVDTTPPFEPMFAALNPADLHADAGLKPGLSSELPKLPFRLLSEEHHVAGDRIAIEATGVSIIGRQTCE